MRDSDRRRSMRLASQELETAIGLLRTAIDKMSSVADRLSRIRDDDNPAFIHERSP